jgi:hypothetical protein
MSLPLRALERVRPVLRWSHRVRTRPRRETKRHTRFEICLVDLIRNSIGPAQRLLDFICLLQQLLHIILHILTVPRDEVSLTRER